MRRFWFALLGLAATCLLEDQQVRAGDYQPENGKRAVVVEDRTWTDKARKRDVPVRIYAPDLKHGRGPFPIIVFSHGGGESRAAFGYLADHWAKQGYLTVCLTHPGTDREAVKAARAGGLAAVGSRADFDLRPQDVQFVLDRILAGKADCALLDGRVDPERIGLAGQCMGCTTAMTLVGLNLKKGDSPAASSIDKRVKAVLALGPQVAAPESGGTKIGLHADSWNSVRGPVMVVTGSKDFLWVKSVRDDPTVRRRAYDGVPGGPKYHVEIADAEHNAFTDSEPWYPVGKRDPRHHDWLRQAGTAFFDAYLKKDKAARDWLQAKKLEEGTKGLCKQEQVVSDNGRPKEAEPGAKKPESAKYDFGAVDKLLEKSVDRMGGGGALILIQDGQVIYRKAFGNFSTDKVVPLASASKWISGAVLMALVDEGKLSLDDKASKFLPWLKGKKGDITIRQMFAHTHGLPDSPPHHRDTRLTMEEAVKKIGDLESVADPGTALFYSGTGMQMAGYIATLAAGKPWEQLFKEKIGDPCEMKATDYYAFGETKNPNVAGSARTNVEDYGNFVTMLQAKGVFKGKRVLSEKAVAEMLKNQTGDAPIKRHPWEGYKEFDAAMAKSGYGIGCWIEERDAKTGETWRVSSGGAFGAQPFLDRKQNLAGVYLPYNPRGHKKGQNGYYNEASVVYLELKKVLADVLAGNEEPISQPKSGLYKSNAKPPHEVAFVALVKLEDKARKKELQVRATYPKGEGPFPVILFSHYAGGSKDEYDGLLGYWSGHGYVCLVPNHADSPQVGGERGAKALQGWRDRAVDVRFLLDSLAEVERLAPELKGKLDVKRIGAGGHYIGAHSTGLVAGMKVFGADGKSETFADPRVRALLMLSPTGRGQGLTEDSWKDMKLPMLVMTGSKDPSTRTSNDPQWRTEPFKFAAPGDKHLVFIEGLDRLYGGLVGKTPKPGDLAPYVQASTLAFWDAYLKDSKDARAYLESDKLPTFSKGMLKLERK